MPASEPGSSVAAPVRALLWRAGIRRPDPWRRTLGLGLRSLGCQFALGAFGLVPPLEGRDADVARELVTRLAGVLRTEACLRHALRHRRSVVERTAKAAVDIVLARYNPDGSLRDIEPLLDPAFPVPLPDAEREKAERAIIESFNAVMGQSERRRARKMTDLAFKRVRPRHSAAAQYAGRLLTGVTICFDDGAGSRFAPPDFGLYRMVGSGFLQVFCRWRVSDRRLDLWFHVHHTGADGAPIQEILTRLERLWRSETVVYPRPSGQAVDDIAEPADREIRLVRMFIDFSPLLALRRRLAPRLEVPAGALLLWLMARQPEFAETRFAMAVDVPENTRFARGVDLIGIRPADFGGGSESASLASFSRHFQQLVSAGRERKSSTYRAMRNLSLLPAWLAQRLLRRNRTASAATFGTVGISILRDARVFVAPMADSGFGGGFIAIGGMNLPSESGGTVGAVTIKGEAIVGYPAAIRRAIVDAARVEPG